MKVQILKNCLNTIDSFTLRSFYEGEIYDLPEFAGKHLIHQKNAKAIQLQIEVSHNNKILIAKK